MESLFFRCAPENQTTFLDCEVIYHNTIMSENASVSGDIVLDATEKNILSPWTNLTICIFYVVILRLVGYLILRFVRNPSKTSG